MEPKKTRSPIACDICRARKRKCDSCFPCEECSTKGLRCTYSPVSSTSNTMGRFVPDHRMGTAAENRPSGVTPEGHQYPLVMRPSDTSNFQNMRQAEPVNGNHASARRQLAIPVRRCSNNSLLLLPEIHSLIGKYPEDFFFLAESRREISQDQLFNPFEDRLTLPAVALDRDKTLSLIHNFFQYTHLSNLFYDEDSFLFRFPCAFNLATGRQEEQAVVLAVFAIGSIVGRNVQSQHEDGENIPGMKFFKPALHILTISWATTFCGTMNLAYGLVLCATYLSYLTQPLRALKLVHLASTTVQQLLIKSHDSFSDREMEELFRIAWSCFLIESDILSEFHQPRSGIMHAVDALRFPSLEKPTNPADMMFWAEISLQLLLNRLHYPPNSSDAPSKRTPEDLLDVCDDLCRRLDIWYQSLPALIQPDLASQEDVNPESYLLRLRYWLVRGTIFRPLIAYVISLKSGETASSAVLDRCSIGLFGCRSFLFFSEKLLTKYTPYTYNAAINCFGSAMVLSLAALSPALRESVPHITELQHIAIARLKPWAQPHTSIECALEILVALQTKMRYR